MLAGEVGFYSARGEAEVQNMGVKQISISNHSTKSDERGGTKSNIGSAKNKSGGPVANGESAYSNGGTVSTVAAIRKLLE